MTTFTMIMLIAVCAGLSLTALAAIIRIMRGPSILDRMVASDVLLTTVMLALGVDMVVRGHTHTVPLMIVIAATATFATIVVAKFVRRKAELETSQATPIEPSVPEGEVTHD
ncbi:sodium:proton antiporter [Leucobacter sp. cx-328]|uniref:monovalent cation/H+ antiporter complex subunit F n=1 Tax=unclassified Leucobacter TaxID=2621730 RepID=UPI00165D9704|nr:MULTISPECIES: monovalent cation/H+ antiporter complex subunit F [unclassified Leucobacter]MBC9944832.1 sodium:proton antiporter [Leucobacter sp. cx-328]